MSLLDLLGRATLSTGVKPPASYTKKVNAKGLATTEELAKAATTGYGFKDASLGSEKYTDVMPGLMGGSKYTGTTPKYQDVAFSDLTMGNSPLLGSKGNTYAFRPGNFKRDVATYTERIFLQQQQAAGQFSRTPSSLISVAAQTVPILTPTATPGSSAPPSNDGRYIPTVGYGFVLYGVLTNGGYA